MSELDIFHNRIGQLLVDAGPADATKIIVCAKLSLNGESCEYEYDYIDFNGKKNWFVPDGLASHNLRILLIEMRNAYVRNNLTNGKSGWNECKIIVDIKSGKINIDFKYEN